jgi:hypothetical protein
MGLWRVNNDRDRKQFTCGAMLAGMKNVKL